MRNRYVKKCDCKSFPVIVRKIDTLRKGVLDIELEVSCSECKRLYREVAPKKTRMIDPDIVGDILKPSEGSSEEADDEIIDSPLESTDTEESETGAADELDNGSDNTETGESEEVSQQEEESTGTPEKDENPKDEPVDEKRNADEAGSPDPVEEPPKKRRGRPPGKNKGAESVEERPIEGAIKDSGIPVGDFF